MLVSWDCMMCGDASPPSHKVISHPLASLGAASTLFQGSIRLNLDLANEFTDTQLWDALDQASPKPCICDNSRVGLHQRSTSIPPLRPCRVIAEDPLHHA